MCATGRFQSLPWAYKSATAVKINLWKACDYDLETLDVSHMEDMLYMRMKGFNHTYESDNERL